MIAVYIILGLILIITALLLIPIRLEFRYGGDTNFIVRYLFFKFDLQSGKELEKRTEEAAEDTGKKSVNLFDRLKRDKGFMQAVTEMGNIVRETAGKLLPLFRRIVVDRFFLEITVGGEDAAVVAISYGTVCSMVYPLRGFLAGIMKFKENHVEITSDFDGGESSALFFTKLHFIPIFAVYAFITLALRILFYKWKEKTSRKRVKDGA